MKHTPLSQSLAALFASLSLVLLLVVTAAGMEQPVTSQLSGFPKPARLTIRFIQQPLPLKQDMPEQVAIEVANKGPAETLRATMSMKIPNRWFIQSMRKDTGINCYQTTEGEGCDMTLSKDRPKQMVFSILLPEGTCHDPATESPFPIQASVRGTQSAGFAVVQTIVRCRKGGK